MLSNNSDVFEKGLFICNCKYTFPILYLTVPVQSGFSFYPVNLILILTEA